MNMISVFVEREKRTPELQEEIMNIDTVEAVSERFADDWFFDCMTERYAIVESALIDLSEKYPDTLISIRVRDTEDFNGGFVSGHIWQEWFLNGDFYDDTAVVVFPEPSDDFLGDYCGAID